MNKDRSLNLQLEMRMYSEIEDKLHKNINHQDSF